LKNNSDILIPQVLIVDKDPAGARVLLEIFARRAIRGIVAETVPCGQQPAVTAFEMVFYAMNDQAGLAGATSAIRHLKASSPELVVIAMLGSDSNNLAVAAMKAGCTEVLTKPLRRDSITKLLDAFLPNHEVPATATGATEADSFRIVGQSLQIKAAIDLATRAARTSIPVMIIGESGTGKELLASLVHSASMRSTGPYIRLNCAAISESLLESELFGHEKGSFTGAYARRKGRFERAHGGTLLFDEITETPLKFQAELLRAIEQQDFERVGGEEKVLVNVRIVSTTNKDIMREVVKGNFREDLYYRLSGVKLKVPALRERRDDMLSLVWHFINLHARESGRRITGIDPLTMDILSSYSWPGNVRQLRNVIRTALALGSGEILSPADIAMVADELVDEPLPQGMETCGLAGRSLQEIEQEAIIATLRQTSGNQTRAAKTLGISDRTLREKIKKYRRQGHLQLTA
jgi:two-component system response regulator HydG